MDGTGVSCNKYNDSSCKLFTGKTTFDSFFFLGGGRIAVDVFIIISAWFMCDSEFKSCRIFSTWVTTFFYSFFVGTVYLLLYNNTAFFVSQLFPCSNKIVWFIRGYLLLLIISPILNLILTRRNISMFFVVVAILFMTYNTVFPMYGKDLFDIGTFSLLYVLIGWYKIHIRNKPKASISFLMFAIVYSFNILWITFFEGIDERLNLAIYGYSGDMFHVHYYNMVTVAAAIFLFFGFSQIKIQNKCISVLSTGTLDVYLLLSMNSPKGLLWWLDVSGLIESSFLEDSLLSVYLICLAIFIITLILGTIRNKLLITISSKGCFYDIFKLIDSRINKITKISMAERFRTQ